MISHRRDRDSKTKQADEGHFVNWLHAADFTDDFESEIYFDPHGGAQASEKEEVTLTDGEDDGAQKEDLRKPKAHPIIRSIISPTSANQQTSVFSTPMNVLSGGPFNSISSSSQ